MAGNQIRIIVEGDSKDSGHLRLNEFLKQLEAVRKALKQTERILNTEENAHVFYRIVDVTHSSPLTVVLEAASETPEMRDVPPAVVGKFLNSIGEIKNRGKLPHDFDYAAAEAYREITTPLSKHISTLVIANGASRYALDRQFEERIVEAIGPDEFADGSVAGTLDTVRLHNTTAFEIFPTIGPKKVSCHFAPEMKEKVKAALEQYVRVFGRLRYKHFDAFPYAIDADDLEIYPPDDELPSLFDVKGMAPDLTGGKSIDEFLERVRDAW